ncbi:helix-turn-helix domain-containing protein [Tepidicella xavieri]|uniref:helix-turn-helix domain-containing protein n=1 Tax=Tepidicella xavieri TaxID=360241 RepID=UPI00105C6A11|nr:helix-turn-helix transcriptional regulator [Tepidicella xavieri]
MDFCYRLSEERKRLGLTQAAAAEICGVSREMWGKYERGAASPGCDVVAKFAAAGADVTYILTGRRERPASELTDRARLLAAIEAIEAGLGDKRLPPAKKAEAILLAYELLAEPAASRDNVVELIRRVA